MYIPDQIVAAGQLAPPATRAALLPPGIGFLLSMVRLRAEGGAAATIAVARSFDHIGWPRGELVLDALIESFATLETLPHRACSLSRHELSLVRAAALLALDLREHAHAELASMLPEGPAATSCSALAELVTELRAAGLGFAMVHIAVPRQVAR